MPSYTASATTEGGRNGHVKSGDGLIQYELSVPKELGGPGRAGAVNPEEFFAAGYSACFGSAVDYAAKLENVRIDGVAVTADVTVNADDTGFNLAVTLKIRVAGVDHATAERLAHKAHNELCPYSKATRNNIPVEIEIV